MTVINLHSTIFNAGKAGGAAVHKLGAALKLAIDNGVTIETIDDYKTDFYAGFMASACQWAEKTARAWLEDDGVKKRVEKGETATPFQRAYGAARVAWSRGRAAAGLVKNVEKATRVPSAPAAKS